MEAGEGRPGRNVSRTFSADPTLYLLLAITVVSVMGKCSV